MNIHLKRGATWQTDGDDRDVAFHDAKQERLVNGAGDVVLDVKVEDDSYADDRDCTHSVTRMISKIEVCESILMVLQ